MAKPLFHFLLALGDRTLEKSFFLRYLKPNPLSEGQFVNLAACFKASSLYCARASET